MTSESGSLMPRNSEAKSRPSRSTKPETGGRVAGGLPQLDAPKTAAQITNRNPRKRFKFEVAAFIAWLRTKGFILDGRERGHWKTHGWAISTSAASYRPVDRSTRRQSTPSRETAQREAREALFRAFKSAATGSSVRIVGTGLAVSKAARVLGLQRYRKGHVSDGKEGKVEFQPLKKVTFENPLASEGPIGRSGTTKKFRNASDSSVRKLPAQPKLWNQDFRGKPAGERDRALITHIENVYGDYLPEHADEMREYLGRKDPRLLAAIKEFGFKNLPENLRMPSIRQKVADRIARAAAGEYGEMTPEEKKSVRTASQRRLSPKI